MFIIIIMDLGSDKLREHIFFKSPISLCPLKLLSYTLEIYIDCQSSRSYRAVTDPGFHEREGLLINIH